MRQSIYETGQYLANKPDWHAGHAPVKAGWISEILDRNRISPKSIVEIGCGAGEILVRLAEIYPAATLEGYDISPQAFAIASPKETDRLKFHHRNFLEEPAKAIDLLMAIDVFEHVEDYMAFIRGLKGRSRYALFHIPLDLSVQMVLRSKPILHVREEVGHLHYFYKDTALATLESTIRRTTRAVLEEARTTGVAPRAVAVALAERRVRAAMRTRRFR